VRSWRRATEAGLCVALALLAGAPAEAHEGEEHGKDGQSEGSAPAATAAAFAAPEPGTYSLPALGAADDGEVLTSEGGATRLHALLGDRAVLLSFVYTHCSDAEGCPFATAMLHRVGHLLRREPEVASRVRLLTLSFDPARDTPEVMRRYGDSFTTEGLDWRFLTGASEEALRPLLEAYGQVPIAETDARGEETGSFSHLLRVFLVDRARRIRNVYSATLLRPEALVADLKTLLLEEDGGSSRPDDVSGEGVASAAALGGPGDDRAGYEREDYRTRSLSLAARRGARTDLVARVEDPPLGLPPVPVPEDNPLSREKVELGRRLFFDRRLSLNDTFSCAMCHVPEQGFAHNELATAVGIEGRTVRRNAPTLYNAAYLEHLFHDGRETRLEHQIWGPLLARNEMGNPSVGAVLEKVSGLSDYAERFEAAFPERGLDIGTLGMAIASYERTLVSGGSPFDRWRYGGEEDALSPAARRGFALFTGKAACATCHTVGGEHSLFTDDAFHDTGLGYEASMGLREEPATRRVQAAPGVYLDVPTEVVAQVSESPPPDLGRYEITLDPADRWRYRTPGLRNVALTAPYMHDGSLATLREVVDFYARGGVPNEGLDPRIRPLDLSEEEKRDLVAFLESLTGGDVEELVADAFAAPIGDAGGSEEREAPQKRYWKPTLPER
jgi:cytochrome c peroxidase